MSETTHEQILKAKNDLLDRYVKDISLLNVKVADANSRAESHLQEIKRQGKLIDKLMRIAPVKFKSRSTGREWKWVANWDEVEETFVK